MSYYLFLAKYEHFRTVFNGRFLEELLSPFSLFSVSKLTTVIGKLNLTGVEHVYFRNSIRFLINNNNIICSGSPLYVNIIILGGVGIYLENFILKNRSDKCLLIFF